MSETTKKRPGKPKLSAEEKARRAAEHAAEPKDARFRRLAQRRVPKAIKVIGYVRNLANRANYQYTDAQREYVCTMLAQAVQDVLDAFHVMEAPVDGFQLPD